jgi:hypothetical protein
VSADAEQTCDRLAEIARLLEQLRVDYRMTLDGNEQFTEPEALVDWSRTLVAREPTAELWHRTLWIEQPYHRSCALTPEVAPALARVVTHKPVVIDESSETDEATEIALALGYRGVSAKNCKGIFRTLHSFRTLRDWQSSHGKPTVLTGEDLTNPGIAALHQDTVVAAALGITHVERNGHHYLRGLDLLTAAERQDALKSYPSLYRETPDLVSLRIVNGQIDLQDLDVPGLGVASEPEWKALEPVELPPAAEETA